jgi:acyl-CoA synthetase (AMP-forming)/AMP-acid ligase II
MNVSEILARNARLYPDDIALVEVLPGKGIRHQVTWREFDARVTRFANALMEMGIGKGDKVNHWMMNSISWQVAYFGILRTGAWVAPLSFRFSSKDLKYCTDVAQARALVFGEEFADRVAAIRGELATIKDFIFVGANLPPDTKSFDDLVGRASDKEVDVEIRDADEAALYFTSGTTGQPKPILLTHANLESACITENFRQRAQHRDNMLIMPPFYHVGAMMHWLGVFIVGARGTIMPEISPQNILKTVSDEKITSSFILLPWMLDILLAIEKKEVKTGDYDLASMRLWYSGAQPIPTSVRHQWKALFPKVPMHVCYGLTESAGPGCIYYDEDCPDGSLGKVGFNWEARVVDDAGEVLPPGKVGELCIKGDGVMKEYYKNPELSARTLRKGWLFTGDMVRMDERGFIFLIDRKKDVIIYGGENIYPAELEAVLIRHPKIYDVAVIGVPDPRLGESPAAIIELKPGMTLTEEEVLQFCDQQELPRYRRPRRIIFDKVPRNPSGKIEKPKLREKYAGTKGMVFNT